MENDTRQLALLDTLIKAALEAPHLQDLLQAFADHMGAIIGADDCYILMWDEHMLSQVHVAISAEQKDPYHALLLEPDGLALITSVLNAGCPLVVEDVYSSDLVKPRLASLLPCRSLICLSLIAGETRSGIVCLAFRERHHFAPEEIVSCERAVMAASLAISRIRLIDETRQRETERKSYNLISAAMRLAPNREALMAAILEKISAIFNADGAALILNDGEFDRNTIELAAGLWNDFTGTQLAGERSVCRQVIRSGEAYQSHQGPTEQEPLEPDLPCGEDVLTCLPLLVQKAPIGALAIRRPLPIDADEMSQLAAIVSLAANAIARQTLYDDLERQLKALQTVQARLVQSEKLAAIGELIAGVAHELNNPLTAVMIYAQMAQQKATNRETRAELEKIVSEAARAASIVRGLLDFSRQRPPERKAVQVNDILRSSLNLVGFELRTHNISSETRLVPDLPMTQADPNQLQQTFINLINNAWQAMSEVKGEGRLLVSTASGPSLFLGNQPGGTEMIRVLFEDSGPGIPSDRLPHIFDPFFSTKGEKGTGLGLSICHGIIAEHQGHLWAENLPGGGARFTVEIPVNQPAPAQKIPVPAALPLEIAPDAARVLIVDDEINVRDVLSMALQRRGYQVDSAGNGEEALAKINAGDYQLIMCDFRMPRMNGKEFYAKIQQSRPGLSRRILFTTGDTINEETRRFLEESRLPFLTKPFELNVFLEKVQELLKESNLFG